MELTFKINTDTDTAEELCKVIDFLTTLIRKPVYPDADFSIPEVEILAGSELDAQVAMAEAGGWCADSHGHEIPGPSQEELINAEFEAAMRQAMGGLGAALCTKTADTHAELAKVLPLRDPFAAKPGPVTEDGMYQAGETIYKVQRAVHGSGNLYAKRLIKRGDTWLFDYAPGAIRDLDSGMRMTPEAAKAFGQLYGICCRCAAPLTDEESIARGMGPICAGKL